ncbi:hypothetical protein ACFQER_01175 [Halomicroarcula sp. GCM10025894]|uniref:hypothetical protein n=1 Tax=Halomicroarcula sp. GCM10025894 TaxID=3252673 RepID=UPI003616EF12
MAGKKRVSENPDDTSQILGAQILGNLTWLSVAALGTFLFADLVVSYTGLQRAPLFIVTLLGSVGVFSTFQSLLKGHGRINLATWIDTVRSYLTTPLQIGLILLGWGAGGWCSASRSRRPR